VARAPRGRHWAVLQGSDDEATARLGKQLEHEGEDQNIGPLAGARTILIGCLRSAQACPHGSVYCLWAQKATGPALCEQ
jgi:hypothetical protein